MALTKIEQYAYGGGIARFLAAFDFDGECVTLKLSPVEDEGNAPVILQFASARMLDDWTEASDETHWPLDIIGFDCYQQSERWKFVLTCDTKEWIWESDWPTPQKLSGGSP